MADDRSAVRASPAYQAMTPVGRKVLAGYRMRSHGGAAVPSRCRAALRRVIGVGDLRRPAV